MASPRLPGEASQAPFIWAADRDSRIIFVRALRTLTAADACAVMDRQIASGLWHYGLLYDLQLTEQATAVEDSRAIAERVTALMRQHAGRGPVALVTRDPAMQHAVSFHGTGTGSGVAIRLFDDFKAAKAWLSGVLGRTASREVNPRPRHVATPSGQRHH